MFGSELAHSLLHLLFPHLCCGCASDRLPASSQLCARCLSELPSTHFSGIPDNPSERIFLGRLPIREASSLFYYARDSVIQEVMHSVKYRGNQSLGRQLGRIMGRTLLDCGRFKNVDLIVPVPLHPRRLRQRGFNQSALLAQGISEILKLPYDAFALERHSSTRTQTQKSRIERWQNMQDRFRVRNADSIQRQHILLVDDVLTTGATLEACGSVLLQVAGVSISVASLCLAIKS